MHAIESSGRLGVIGAGVMAEAMIDGLLAQGVYPAAAITCADPQESRRSHLASRHGVRTTADNRAAAAAADIAILAVKPQVLAGALAGLQGSLRPETLVISIVAGAGSQALAAGLRHRRLVRAMPNTPAQVGAGITVWYATPEVEAADRTRCRAVLGALGSQVEVDEERLVGIATAVSGSGPAYVFLFMEALIDAAVELGLTRPVARTLVVETLRGSSELAGGSEKHLAELRNLVTSPGGTSAAGLHELEAGALRSLTARAVRAAHRRALELEALCDREMHGLQGGH